MLRNFSSWLLNQSLLHQQALNALHLGTARVSSLLPHRRVGVHHLLRLCHHLCRHQTQHPVAWVIIRSYLVMCTTRLPYVSRSASTICSLARASARSSSPLRSAVARTRSYASRLLKNVCAAFRAASSLVPKAASDAAYSATALNNHVRAETSLEMKRTERRRAAI